MEARLMAIVSEFQIYADAAAADETREFQPKLPPISRAILQSAASRAAKRALDIFGAGIGVILLAPLLVLVAAGVYALQGWPIVITHRRIGFAGNAFPCLKFRSMVTDGDAILRRHLMADPAARREWEEKRKLKDDPRITPLGYFLRRSSLDELPQLLNILRGDMSLVGPRPIVFDEAAHYGDNIVDYLSVRPGLTGMWQVNGRSHTDYRERVSLDVRYARRRTFAQDIRILVKTMHVVLASKGSY
jgi:exopolysaccharide production protein ExoY